MTRVSEPPNLRDQQKEETRRRVLDAALAVFRRDGVEAARIEDVVTLAGVSRGTFYFHFPTKDDVLAEVLRRSSAEVAAAIDGLPPRASPARILEALAAATMEQWQGDPELFPAVGMVALKLTATGALNHETDPVRAAVARQFRAAAERGDLTDALPPEQLADAFLLSAFAVLMNWARNPEGSLDDALKKTAKLFLDGARARK